MDPPNPCTTGGISIELASACDINSYVFRDATVFFLLSNEKTC